MLQLQRSPVLLPLALLLLSPAVAAGDLRGDVRLDTSFLPGATESDESEIASSGNSFFSVWFEQDPVTGRDIYYSRSIDGGRTWTSSVRLDLDPGTASQEGPIVLASGSTVFVAWLDDRAAAGLHDVRSRVSQDGGLTFGPEVNVSGTLAGDLGDADNLVGAISAPFVFVGFEDDAVAKSISPLAVNEDFFVAASTNGGASFGSPLLVNHPPLGPGTADVDDPQLTAQGSLAYATWVDRRNAFADEVFFSRSTGGGASWPAVDVQLDPTGNPGLDVEDPRIAVSGANVFVMWRDQRNEPIALGYQVFINSSANGGTTWQGDVRLDGAGPLDIDSRRGRIAADGVKFHAVWSDNRNNIAGNIHDIFYRQGAITGGVLALGGEQRLDVGSPPGAADGSLPRVIAAGDYVYACYQDRRKDALGVNDSVFLRVSNNGGTTFGKEQDCTSDLSGAEDAEEAGMAVSAYRDVVCIWTDNRNGTGLQPLNDVFVNGQRFPNLEHKKAGGTLSFEVTDAALSQDQGSVFFILASVSGVALTPVPFSTTGLKMNLTIDQITIATVGSSVLVGTVNAGTAQTPAFPYSFPGTVFAAAVFYNPATFFNFHAATDPIVIQ